MLDLLDPNCRKKHSPSDFGSTTRHSLTVDTGIYKMPLYSEPPYRINDRRNNVSM